MASADAIAHLGETLTSLIAQKLVGMVNATDIKLITLDNLKDYPRTPPSVSIFLYHVALNGEMRNMPRSGRLGAQKPPLPLELRFMITPWTLLTTDAYRIVGAIAQLFHDRAVLRRSDLIGDAWDEDDTVELVMESLPVEQHYDIWKSTEIPYRLSLTYVARIIGIDSALSRGAPNVISVTAAVPAKGAS